MLAQATKPASTAEGATTHTHGGGQCAMSPTGRTASVAEVGVCYEIGMSGVHPRTRALRILVVDDDEDTRDLYIEALTLAGFDARGAADAPTALALARTLEPAVITIDVSLPGMSGIEVTRILKADPATSGILVFILTGHVEARFSDEAASAGCDAFIAKPCVPTALLEQILRALDPSSRTGALDAGS